MNFDYAHMGRRIREERHKRGWTLGDLSEHTGISCSHLSCIERGMSEFSVGYLAKITQALDLSADYLLIGQVASSASSSQLLSQAVQDCNPAELRIIIDNVILLKDNLRKFYH